MKPLGRNRWTFFYDRGHGDGLVHTVLAMYDSSFEQLDVNVYPNDGITECGVHVKLYPASKGRAVQGVYVDDSHMLTCIRCLSGRSTDGISFRAEQKNLLFAQRYGKTGPTLQNIPPPKMRGQRALTTVFDEAKHYKLGSYETWIAAILAPLPKP